VTGGRPASSAAADYDDDDDETAPVEYSHYYSVPVTVRSIVMSGLSVCLSVRTYISETTPPNFTQFSVYAVARSFSLGDLICYVYF